jgi:NAD-dependent deacetylase sirtuin 4
MYSGVQRGMANTLLEADLPDPASVERLMGLLTRRRLVVLAGAGCSTESGIPDYRGGGSDRPPPTPVQYQDFIRSQAARARYWARATVGWPRFVTARPNAAHLALAQLEAAGLVTGIITQNVDGLHQAAGSHRVVELHGSLAQVRCLGCGCTCPRGEVQERLLRLNEAWAQRLELQGGTEPFQAAPDGDAQLPAVATDDFRVPDCLSCGGILKPDVVFFGENVPRPTVEAAWRQFDEGDVLLVVGSSLAVYSGRRFTDRAAQTGVPIAIINVGPTRADALATARVHARVGIVLPLLANGLVDAVGSAHPGHVTAA